MLLTCFISQTVHKSAMEFLILKKNGLENQALTKLVLLGWAKHWNSVHLSTILPPIMFSDCCV